MLNWQTIRQLAGEYTYNIRDGSYRIIFIESFYKTVELVHKICRRCNEYATERTTNLFASCRLELATIFLQLNLSRGSCSRRDAFFFTTIQRNYRELYSSLSVTFN